ncbi:hypothetical protein PITCH_A1010016 [uncultured Desulfobacterium sp.]|uniref:Uncharacterized protein n=1 Tax=uncultured Desulfobacterium sp. TaxID=201089 RepID=A0A445MQM2_9BACT|nr:hypothetical protein PITCH_A1010016 [uncultured Desulfobacterium sp.]
MQTQGLPLLAAPSHLLKNRQWHYAAFVPDYSGGPVPELHGVPFYAQYERLNLAGIDIDNFNECQQKNSSGADTQYGPQFFKAPGRKLSPVVDK